MTRIALVISDVDGTLLTRDKVLTDKAARAARQLQDSGVGFTIVSSRPTIGMRFLIEPLRITLPIGSFNGSSITDPQLNPIEQHLIPTSAAQRSLKVLNQFKVDIWLFTNDKWLTRNRDGEYNPLEKRAIKTDPVIVEDFAPYLSAACKIVGSTSDAALLQRCENAIQQALGTQALAVRSQSYYLDITPPGYDKGTFVEAIARRMGFRPMRSPPLVTCTTISRCFASAECRSRWAMRPTTSSGRRPTSRHRTRTRVLRVRLTS
jgi:HAD superfamily hydrolase (TIGR01484 family)